MKLGEVLLFKALEKKIFVFILYLSTVMRNDYIVFMNN